MSNVGWMMKVFCACVVCSVLLIPQNTKAALGGSAAEAAATCKQILDYGASAGDGVYWLDLDGTGADAPVLVFCDMTTDGGGWMLAVNSVAGEEPVTTDMVSNTGTAGPATAHTRNMNNWAITQQAQIRHQIVDNANSRTFNAYYTGAYHDILPDYTNWTELRAHSPGAEALLQSSFAMQWTQFDLDNDLSSGNCAIDYGVPWHFNNCFTSLPADLSDGATQGPVTNC